jgi:hypothetical protein
MGVTPSGREECGGGRERCEWCERVAVANVCVHDRGAAVVVSVVSGPSD